METQEATVYMPPKTLRCAVLMIKDPKQGSKHSNVMQAELCFDIINMYVFWFSFACLFV